jgi:membrane protease YdiL (CAAX protease family)
MKNDTLDYKFVFVGIIVAYYIAQFILIYFKPELARYATLLQILFFIIPLIIIKDDNLKYKINSFSITTIPIILWALLGITLLEIGIDIVMKHILPDFILTQYDNLYNNYSTEINKIIINDSNTILEFSIITFCIAIIPAACEEILFRGYLIQKIMKKHTPMFAIIISALLFAIIHLNPISFIPIFILGLFMGSLFYQTNSIIPPILLHFLNNFLVILSANYYNESELDTSTPTIWSGIIFTFIGIIIMLLSKRFIKSKSNYFSLP